MAVSKGCGMNRHSEVAIPTLRHSAAPRFFGRTQPTFASVGGDYKFPPIGDVVLHPKPPEIRLAVPKMMRDITDLGGDKNIETE